MIHYRAAARAEVAATISRRAAADSARPAKVNEMVKIREISTGLRARKFRLSGSEAGRSHWPAGRNPRRLEARLPSQRKTGR